MNEPHRLHVVFLDDDPSARHLRVQLEHFEPIKRIEGSV